MQIGVQCSGLKVKGSVQAFLSAQGAKDAWAKNQILNTSASVLAASF